MDKIYIDNPLSSALDLGNLSYLDIRIKDTDGLNLYINSEVPKLKQAFLSKLPESYNGSRRLYRSFRIDPTKHRPSSEALWRRIKRELPFPTVNPFVDIVNFLSLSLQIPYGLYDLDKIKGSISVAVGGRDDYYQGIRKDQINLEGKITLKDSIGPFGNPSSDSNRTATAKGTQNILIVMFLPAENTIKQEVIQTTRALFERFFTYQAVAGDT